MVMKCERCQMEFNVDNTFGKKEKVEVKCERNDNDETKYARVRVR